MSVESAEAPREQLDLSGGRCPECGGPHVRQRGTAHFDGCSKWDALNRAVRPVAQPLAPRSEPSEAAIEAAQMVEMQYDAHGNYDVDATTRAELRAAYAVDFGGAVDS